ncbi:Aldo/keto reductase [Trichocladium antarcticum]|uniref:Aldo/keto reductase n=1 Tax=Trichocladium antarcticum TaxID=1450529 RepID=A0AAN6ZDI9_9PEZI|nr:Aldo/keto reductase [Trichocladium antarcticum]
MPTNPLPPGPPAPSPLGRYRLLSPTASIRVSPVVLGGINFGDAWKDYIGACDEKTCEEILDYFFEKGGNLIDTSNNYPFEESEQRIGAWMKTRDNRDQMVIATKYSAMAPRACTPRSRPVSGKLQTEYIDLVCLQFSGSCVSVVACNLPTTAYLRCCSTNP